MEESHRRKGKAPSALVSAWRYTSAQWTKRGGWKQAVGSRSPSGTSGQPFEFTYRDKSDSTGKRAFKVQTPRRILYYTTAVFLIIPLFGFFWKETHLVPTEHYSEKEMLKQQHGYHSQHNRFPSWMEAAEEEKSEETEKKPEEDNEGDETVAAEDKSVQDEGEPRPEKHASKSSSVDLAAQEADGVGDSAKMSVSKDAAGAVKESNDRESPDHDDNLNKGDGSAEADKTVEEELKEAAEHEEISKEAELKNLDEGGDVPSEQVAGELSLENASTGEDGIKKEIDPMLRGTDTG